MPAVCVCALCLPSQGCVLLCRVLSLFASLKITFILDELGGSLYEEIGLILEYLCLSTTVPLLHVYTSGYPMRSCLHSFYVWAVFRVFLSKILESVWKM